jgi:hypothetical protein
MMEELLELWTLLRKSYILWKNLLKSRQWGRWRILLAVKLLIQLIRLGVWIHQPKLLKNLKENFA